MTYINITNFVLINWLEKDQSIIEIHCLRNFDICIYIYIIYIKIYNVCIYIYIYIYIKKSHDLFAGAFQLPWNFLELIQRFQEFWVIQNVLWKCDIVFLILYFVKLLPENDFRMYTRNRESVENHLTLWSDGI